MKAQQLLWLSACLFGAACLGEAPGEPVEGLEQAITGGTLLTEAQNVGVDACVVRFGPNCTATKLLPTWYLTSASCLSGLPAGQTIQITNSISGALNDRAPFITLDRVVPHPSLRSSGEIRSYDVGLVKSREVVADIPNLFTSGLHVPHVPVGVANAALTAYGCNLLNRTRDNWKHYAFFPTDVEPQFGRATFRIWTPGSNPEVCGDRGGPLFIKSGGAWRVGGIALSPTGFSAGEDPGSPFARTGNVRQWILDVIAGNPGFNHYVDQKRGFLVNEASRLCVSSNNILGNGSLMQQITCDGRTAGELATADPQYWILTPNGTGRWKFRNTFSNRCLDGVSSANDTPVAQVTCANVASQSWNIVPNLPYRKFRNDQSGLCMYAPFGSIDGALVRQQPCDTGASALQQWQFRQ